jgi:hypothetical protein
VPLTWAFFMERMTGIEPAFSAWEADVLPLNYIRVLLHDRITLALGHRRHLRQRPRRTRCPPLGEPFDAPTVDFRWPEPHTVLAPRPRRATP